MATFLVVHGAWTGGWSWRKMHEPLRRRGHVLLTPTLTGLGERAHLASTDVDLEMHVADILGVIRCEGLRNLILLGHSYGGMVAAVVAARVPDRVSQVVFLDAFVPREGECLLDLLPPGQADRMRNAAARGGDGWKVPPNPLPPDTPPEDVEWMAPLREMQPIATFEQVARLGSHPSSMPTTYIYCGRAGPGDAFRFFLQRAREDTGWRHFEIDASHSPQVTAPEVLAQVLERIAADDAS